MSKRGSKSLDTATAASSVAAPSVADIALKLTFGYIPCVSGIAMLTMSLRALLYGDVMKWFSMSVWALVVACVLSLGFFIVFLAWITAWCRNQTSKNTNTFAMNAFVITFISLLIALVVGLSYVSVDSDSVGDFDQNFPENFYNFTTEKMQAAYTKWMSIFLFTAVFSFLQVERAMKCCVRC